MNQEISFFNSNIHLINILLTHKAAYMVIEVNKSLLIIF